VFCFVFCLLFIILFCLFCFVLFCLCFVLFLSCLYFVVFCFALCFTTSRLLRATCAGCSAVSRRPIQERVRCEGILAITNTPIAAPAPKKNKKTIPIVFRGRSLQRIIIWTKTSVCACDCVIRVSFYRIERFVSLSLCHLHRYFSSSLVAERVPTLPAVLHQ
jgi:hypothetical protein